MLPLGRVKSSYLNESTNVLLILRRSQLNKRGFRRFCCTRTLCRRYGVCCGKKTRIGIVFEHPCYQGIIDETVEMVDGCRILQQVTLGCAEKGYYKCGLQPRFFGAGARP